MAAWHQTHPSMVKVNPFLTRVLEKVNLLINKSSLKCNHLTDRIERHAVRDTHTLSRIDSKFLQHMEDWKMHVKEFHSQLCREFDFVQYSLTRPSATHEGPLTFQHWIDKYFLASKSVLQRMIGDIDIHQGEQTHFQRLDCLLENPNPFLCASGRALAVQMKIIVDDLREETRAYAHYLEDKLRLLQVDMELIEEDLDHSDNEEAPEADKHTDILQVIEGNDERRRVRKRLRRGGDEEAKWMREVVYRHKLPKVAKMDMDEVVMADIASTSLPNCPES